MFTLQFAKNIKNERQYWRIIAKLYLNLLKSPLLTSALIYFNQPIHMHKNIPTICCFLRTVMTSKQCRWDYEIFQWNWQKAWDILQKKDSDGMRQECEVQLHTHTGWFYSRRVHSYLLNMVSHVYCEVMCSCYLLDGDSLLHTRKERKNHKCLASSISQSVLLDNNDVMWGGIFYYSK